MSISACDTSIPAKVRKKSVDTHQRVLTMDSVRNMRDLGGYKTADGRSLRWGVLYRSAALHEASVEDLYFIQHQLGIKQVIDLRNHTEQALDIEPGAIVDQPEGHYFQLDVMVEGTARDDLVAMLRSPEPEKQDFPALLKNVNERLALEHQQDMRAFFDILLNYDGPFLFHCTEGKDRTGFAAALVLAALGVDQKTIYQDYLLTNTVNQKHIEARLTQVHAMSLFQISRQQLRELLMVDQSYLQAGFEAIEQKYGNVPNYLEQALGLDDAKIQQLQQKFLQ